jgi:hypothetical protein
MLNRVFRRKDQEYAKDSIDAHNHLKVVNTVTAMPHPTRWPHYAQRVDKQKNHTE